MTVASTPGVDTPLTNFRMAIQNAIDGALGELHTMIPGIVVEYDADKQTADIQVAIKRLTTDGEKIIIPTIRNVPIVFPRSAAASITFPLAKNDPVMLLFSERPLDRWRQSGGLVDPGDHRFFHQYTDAFAVPGPFPDSSPVTWDNADDKGGVCVQTSTAKIVIDANGKIRIGKRGAVPGEPAVLGQQLLDYLSALHTAVDTVLQLIITGPIGVGNLGAPVPTDPALVIALTAQKTAIANLKTQYVTTAATNVASQRTFVDRGS
jgi:hypothetical protein